MVIFGKKQRLREVKIVGFLRGFQKLFPMVKFEILHRDDTDACMFPFLTFTLLGAETLS